jgi:hypothetical protein
MHHFCHFYHFCRFFRREVSMATLVVHDLSESVELDRQAMAAITGGSMVQAQQTLFARRHQFTGLPQSAFTNVQGTVPFERPDVPVRMTLLR